MRWECRRCGRGCTYKRLERNPWVRVDGLGGAFLLCWICADVWEFEPTDRVTLVFGDTTEHVHFRRVTRDEAA